MIEAYVFVLTSAGTAPSIVDRIREIEGVRRANVVAGEFDVIAEIEADSQQDLLALVTEEIQRIDGVGRTRTSIILD